VGEQLVCRDAGEDVLGERPEVVSSESKLFFARSMTSALETRWPAEKASVRKWPAKAL
jgi:hypothetical protein